MSILELIILLVATVIVAGVVAYQMQRGTKAMSEFKTDYDNNVEVQELADLAKELYNKDLRPVAPKTTIKKNKSEFPIDKPVKKDKPVQVTSQDITPQVIEKAVEIAKQAPEVIEPVVEAQPVVEVAPPTVEPVVEAPKPARKKRKYYPKKK